MKQNNRTWTRVITDSKWVERRKWRKGYIYVINKGIIIQETYNMSLKVCGSVI